jgi:uncharacterized membrane protein
VRNLFLWLHIAIAIVAFGPTFTFPVWTKMARTAGGPAMPFTLGTLKRLFERVIIPLAIAMPITGVILIFVADWDLWSEPWLIVAIVLYAIAFTNAVGFAYPNVKAMVRILAPGPPAPEAMAELQARANRARVFGLVNQVLILSIVALMVAKPG